MKLVLLGLSSLAFASILHGEEKAADPTFNILSEREIKTEGGSVTYALVKPPTDLPKRPAEPVSIARQITPAELAEAIRQEAKEHITLNVSATVYLTSPIISEIKLRCGDREYTCYSSADFRDLTQTTDFKDERAVYSWQPWVYDVAPDANNPLPSAPALNTAKAGYVVVSPSISDADAAAFRGLDLIHAFYSANKDRLRRERIAREAANAAREKALRDNPPPPQDAKVFIWKKPSAQ